MGRKASISDHLVHAGAGSALAPAWLGLIPGFIPTFALTVLVGAVVVVPVVAVGLALAVIAGRPAPSGGSRTTTPRRRLRNQRRSRNG